VNEEDRVEDVTVTEEAGGVAVSAQASPPSVDGLTRNTERQDSTRLNAEGIAEGGRLVLREQLSDTYSVEIWDFGTESLTISRGHSEYDADLIARDFEADQADTIEDFYRVMLQRSEAEVPLEIRALSERR
jgi:hypothetical protein